MGGQPDLVYDVGMHDGADTAYYLSRGLRVVAVEANPSMVALARERFADAIVDGRLTLLSVGIADETGLAQFWVCDDHTEWSSFDRAVASREGSRHHAVEVQLTRFADLLEAHGVPRFCKIDIEGNDQLCLDGITPDKRPDFISVELSRGDQLERLAVLGYDRFKLIEQVGHTPITGLRLTAGRLLPTNLTAIVDRLARRLRRANHDGAWRFPYGSSGPLPDRTPGRWKSLEETRGMVEEIRKGHEAHGLDLRTWFDIHATHAAALS